MKIIERSPIPYPPGGLSLIDRLRGTFSFGFAWFRQLQAEQGVIDLLSRYLDDEHILFHNLALPGKDYPLPLLLVGPPGLVVMNVASLQGAFRARGEDWLALGSGEKYTPAAPNLLLRTTAMTRAVSSLLEQGGLSAPAPTPVLLAANTHLTVESVRPLVRVVMSDAIEKFAASLAQGQAVLDAAQVEAIAACLENPTPAQPEPQEDLRAALESETKAEPQPKPKPRSPAALPGFSRQQWTVLGVMAGLLVLALIAFIILALISLS
jgi:hypothetical protein